ncbi:hypothetical protein HU200_018298 [Digitaria exilis]|uniref:Uncharacterized protein n=1 Tax=Digitaria exilis TaxID=1010633 RepID=A0A835F5S5_9POAL|nr:hypothetical protein HU200_018298 [Digitaria exilis]
MDNRRARKRRARKRRARKRRSCGDAERAALRCATLPRHTDRSTTSQPAAWDHRAHAAEPAPRGRACARRRPRERDRSGSRANDGGGRCGLDGTGKLVFSDFQQPSVASDGDGRIDDGLSLDVNNGEAKWLYFYGFEGAIFVLEVLFTVFACYGIVLLEIVLGREVLDLAVDADSDEEVHKVLKKLVARFLICWIESNHQLSISLWISD